MKFSHLGLDETLLKQWELWLHRLLFHVPCTVTLLLYSLSSEVSTANFSCWLVLIRCNLLFSPEEFQLPVYLSSTVTPFLSPRGFHLPTFCVDWCSSAVIFFLSPREFQLPVYLSFTVTSFPSPQGFQLPFFRIHWHFSAVK